MCVDECKNSEKAILTVDIHLSILISNINWSGDMKVLNFRRDIYHIDRRKLWTTSKAMIYSAGETWQW